MDQSGRSHSVEAGRCSGPPFYRHWADETLRDGFCPGRTIRLLPLLAFADAISRYGRAAETPLPATIVIDDPNLHSCRYGHLDYRQILAISETTPIHVALAVIPLDMWHASPSAVRALVDGRSALSALVHGNNHTRRELGRARSEERGLALLGEALRRVESLERRHGIVVSRTMAPPHGACSREMVRWLVRSGFDALVVSRPEPWSDGLIADRASDPLIGAEPVSIRDGLPIVPRILIDRLDLLPYAAFLEQPLIVYGHHGDWPDARDLANTAQVVGRSANVHWTRVDDASHWANTMTIDRREATVFMRSRLASVHVPPGVTTLAVSPHSIDPRDVVAVNGIHVHPGASFDVTPGDPIEIRLNALDSTAWLRTTQRIPALLAGGRRILTESRDRFGPLRPSRAKKQEPAGVVNQAEAAPDPHIQTWLTLEVQATLARANEVPEEVEYTLGT